MMRGLALVPDATAGVIDSGVPMAAAVSNIRHLRIAYSVAGRAARIPRRTADRVAGSGGDEAQARRGLATAGREQRGRAVELEGDRRPVLGDNLHASSVITDMFDGAVD